MSVSQIARGLLLTSFFCWHVCCRCCSCWCCCRSGIAMCLCGRGAHQQQQSDSSTAALARSGNRIACSPCQQQRELLHWQSPAATAAGFVVCCSWVVPLQTSWAVCWGGQTAGSSTVDCAGHVSGTTVLCCQVTVGRPREDYFCCSTVCVCVSLPGSGVLGTVSLPACCGVECMAVL